jgi:hypothetical protein
MLDPWIIEEIKRREQRKQEMPAVIELPMHGPEGRDRERPRPKTEEDPPRGVEIIDYGIACW